MNTVNTGRFMAIFVLLLQACSFGFDNGEDARLGRYGRVRFVGGGGCTDSTTLALGSTATLTAEPAQGQILPTDLTPRSSAPESIGASHGPKPYEILLSAVREGAADIELVSSEVGVYDVLGFDVAPAASVSYQAPAEVYAGGGLLLKIDEVFGECGEDCKLIGGGFVQWSAEPAGSLTLDLHEDRVAIMAAGAAGEARVLGREPTTGTVLIDHAVTVVPTEGAGELETRVTIMRPDETVLDPQPMPSEVSVGCLLLIEVEVADAGGRSVKLAGQDVGWTVEGDAGVIAPWPENEPPAPEGPIYEATGAGTVTLVGEAALLGRSRRFEVTIVD